METVARVVRCLRYPVKSLQGIEVDEVVVDANGVAGDRARGLIDDTTGRLLSAKRQRELLEASATDTTVTLPDGSVHGLDDPGTEAALGAWLGRRVRLAEAASTGPVTYQMTFGPPGPDRTVVDVPTPAGTFLDVAPVHLLSTASLAAGAGARPDLDWDVRRFRPNLVVDVGGEGLVEDAWVGHRLHVGAAVLEADGRTVRCAMPMRAQRGIERTPELFRALVALNQNHLGLYCSVVAGGVVRVGDPITLATT